MLLWRSSWAIFILSANGAILNVNLHQPNSSVGTLTNEVLLFSFSSNDFSKWAASRLSRTNGCVQLLFCCIQFCTSVLYLFLSGCLCSALLCNESFNNSTSLFLQALKPRWKIFYFHILGPKYCQKSVKNQRYIRYW